jgi:uncharacterized transporter YbjL
MTALAPLILILMAMGLMLGLVKPRRIGRYIVGMILTPVVIAVAFATARQFYSGLTLSGKLVLIASTPAILLCVGLYVLPHHLRERIISDFLYDMLKLIVLAPFRILAWICRSLFRRDHPSRESGQLGASSSRSSGVPPTAASARRETPPTRSR